MKKAVGSVSLYLTFHGFIVIITSNEVYVVVFFMSQVIYITNPNKSILNRLKELNSMEYTKLVGMLEGMGYLMADTTFNIDPKEWLVVTVDISEDDCIEVQFKRNFDKIGLTYSEVVKQATDINLYTRNKGDYTRCIVWGVW